MPAALGYAEASGIPFDLGIIRNHYVGRTFIQPTQKDRTDSVKLKHNANPAAVRGKRIILLMIRSYAARHREDRHHDAKCGRGEVHMRIASPPTTHPCFYGVDTPSQDQLIAAQMSITDIAGRSMPIASPLSRLTACIVPSPDRQDADALISATRVLPATIRYACSGLSAKRVSHGSAS